MAAFAADTARFLSSCWKEESLGGTTDAAAYQTEKRTSLCLQANIITMTKTGAAKLVASGIRVNCVSPSLTDTVL